MIQTMTELQATNGLDPLCLLPYGMPRPNNPVPPPDSSASGLSALIDAVSHTDHSFVPAVPQDLNDTGVNESVIEELILKTIYSRGELIGRELAASLGLKFSVIERVVEQLKRQRLIQANGSPGFGIVSAVFGISEAGRVRVRECLEQNQYVGPVPVPMAQYAEAVRRQRPKRGWLTKEALRLAYKGIIVSPQEGLITQLLRLQVRREDQERVERSFHFAAGVKRQIIHSPLHRDNPAVQHFGGARFLAAKVVDQINSVVGLKLERRIVDLGYRVVAQVQHVDAEFSSSDDKGPAAADPAAVVVHFRGDRAGFSIAVIHAAMMLWIEEEDDLCMVFDC